MKEKPDYIAKFDVENAISKISTGKAMSIDIFPDELINDNEIKAKLID